LKKLSYSAALYTFKNTPVIPNNMLVVESQQENLRDW